MDTAASRIDKYEAADVLLKQVYSGVLGPTKDLGVSYSLLYETNDSFTYAAALESFDGPPKPIDRYQIDIDRRTKDVSEPRLIEITANDMREAIRVATGETLSSSQRYIDGGLSISYLVVTKERPDVSYIVQLRHHGNVASMDAFMKFVRTNSPTGAIPIPEVYPIPGEEELQRRTGFGRQIAQFVPGVMAEGVYPAMSHPERLKFVRRMAIAWQTCWDLPLASPRRIGELLAEERDGLTILSVGPDRHFSLGGPFASVREWLKARLQHALESLERASGIDDFKEVYLERIRLIVRDHLDMIPESVEQCPVVALHVDMGLHNIIVAAEDPTDIKAIIDWEFCASAPYLAAYECLDRLFRMGAENGFGQEYPLAQELRDAFWSAISRWKAQWESLSSQDFLTWFRFGLFMKPSYCSKQWPKEKKWEFWAENIRVVESMLAQCGLEGDLKMKPH